LSYLSVEKHKIILSMNNSRQFIRLIWVVFFGLTWLSSCQQKNVRPTDEATALKNSTLAIMREWYLWNDQLPANVNTADYPDAQAMINAIGFRDDKWSYIDLYDNYTRFFSAGQSIAHGFSMRWDASGNLWVAFSYRNSPAEQGGLVRGCQIIEINGAPVRLIGANGLSTALGPATEGYRNSFNFIDNNGVNRTASIIKTTVQLNTVLHSQVIPSGSRKVGYLVFNSFLETSTAELNTVFNDFNAQGVNELILDLRYNGGGRISVAQYLASLIVPTRFVGSTFLTYLHNANKTSENQSLRFISTLAPSLSLSRVFIITTPATASASESIINCLRPYMRVVQVGATTAGKPVGSYAFQSGRVVVVPVSLRVANANGVADYYNGLVADIPAEDDASKPWGNVADPCLAQVLTALGNPAFALRTTDAQANNALAWQRNKEMFPQPGLQQEAGIF
jgi:C-terminal processing protease CtpA/Prc